MLKSQLILATTILAGQVLAADQALPTKLRYDEMGSSSHLEVRNQPNKRAELDADQSAPNCRDACLPFFASDDVCRAQGKGVLDPNSGLSACQCQKEYIENMISCASCGPIIAERVSLVNDIAAATYIGACSCHNNGTAVVVSLDSLPGTASEDDLKKLQVCPYKTGSAFTANGLQGLTFTIGMTIAVVAARYAI